jgi:ABC-type nitrate/sulfonate/bicarbonate transport system substrate-binding protein
MPEKQKRLLFTIILCACWFASTAAAYPQKFRVAYTAFAGTFTILWVGKDGGLYQKHGVDTELLFIGSSTTAVQALLAGDVDIVYSAAAAVIDANLAGADLTMVGCQYDTGQTSFFTTAPFASVAALKGKALARSPISSRAMC